MREITKEELQTILEKHGKWLRGEKDGELADLRGADLRGADLGGADLRGADLRRANLYGADLRGADLGWASLRVADLRVADLRGADLGGADLRGADLRRANLYGADLRRANLYGADLYGAKIKESIKNKLYPLVCPEEGDFIGWKKCRNGVIVKLLITGKRSSAYSRKCRCSEAKVIEIQNKDGTKAEGNEATSSYKPDFRYIVGDTVKVDDYDEDRWEECSGGIHFFITRQEAVDYNL